MDKHERIYPWPYISVHFFKNNPYSLHERAVRRIKKYLTSTSTYMDLPDGNRRLSTRGVFYSTNKEKGIGCYIYAKFPSGISQANTNNAENAVSRMG